MNYLSCAAQQLYGAGGFNDDPALFAQLLRRADTGVHFVGELFPSFCYTRKPPEAIHAADGFGEVLLTQYQRINAECPQGAACVVVELAAAVVADNVLYLQRDGEQHVVYETHRPADRAAVSLLKPEAVVTAYPVAANTLYFYLGSAGSFNYGHWLVDDLPRLQAVALLRSQHPQQRIVILLPAFMHAMGKRRARQWNKTRADAVRVFLHGERNFSVDFIDVHSTYGFDQLFYATPVSCHPALKSPQALQLVASKFRARRGWWQKYRRHPTRIFITRGQVHARTLVNTQALHTLLQQHGFVGVDPATLSVARQAAIFSEADIVVGTMGAAMTNTVFCRPGTRVIHLAPSGWTEPFYWDLATICDHRYIACYGAALPTPGPAHMTSFEMPLDLLQAALAAG